MLKIIICGANGKMGRAVTASASENQFFEVIAGIDRITANDSGFPIYASFSECNKTADVIIDFSRPEAIEDILSFSLKNRCNVVLATTGFSEEQQKMIDEASQKIAVFQSFNMSLGINLLASLVKQAAAFLGDDFDIEIVEKHHSQKIDAPSGTAFMLANSINEVFQPKKELNLGRSGGNCKREKSEIGIHAIRGGTVVGEHEVLFLGKHEAVTITHQAFSREILANGALRAALFIKDKQHGKFNMDDMIKDMKK